MDTVIQKIKDKLSEDGTEVYFPSYHKGECSKPYIVVKHAGAVDIPNISSDRPLYDIMLYVPENKYSFLEEFRNKTMSKLKTLFPMIKFVDGSDVGTIYEEEIKAHMLSIQYQGIRKL